MASPQSPLRTSDRALEQIRYIRDTIDGATRFTAVPGRGTALIGTTAVVAAFIAYRQPTLDGALLTWTGEAFVAITIGVIALYRKMRRTGIGFVRGPARKFLLALVPPGICSAALSLVLALRDETAFVAPVWLMGYGTAVIAAGAHSVVAVPIMGASFVVLGLVSLFVAPELHNALLALGFGLGHIVFGTFIAHRHGG
jgi:hypothetical protein